MPNPYEAAARLLKADKLVSVLEQAHIDAALAREMEPKDWAVAARTAKVRPPSTDTQNLVVAALERRAGVAA